MGERFLHRALDSTGQTIDFMLSAKRDTKAAKRFFRKMLKAPKHQSPRVINVDRNNAYPPAVEELKEEGVLAVTSQLRQCKYLNNIVEQDHRFIKRRVNTGLGFFSFKTARRTIKGYEAMNMIRKGQIDGVGKGAIQGQLRYVNSLFRGAIRTSDRDQRNVKQMLCFRWADDQIFRINRKGFSRHHSIEPRVVGS